MRVYVLRVVFALAFGAPKDAGRHLKAGYVHEVEADTAAALIADGAAQDGEAMPDAPTADVEYAPGREPVAAEPETPAPKGKAAA